MSTEQKRVRVLAAVVVLVAVTLVLFWPLTRFEFVSFDDNLFVYRNSHVLSGITRENVTWAFTSLEPYNWIPLTWLSHMVDVELYGLEAGGHHLTSLLLHAANTALIFLVLQAMTGAFWRSAAVAALFGVHPLHVESVAWVAERRDVLSTFFWMLALLAYRHYVRTLSWQSYLLTAICLACGLMAKPMLVTLPFLLLLLDYWPLRRLAGLSPAAPGGGESLPSVPLFRAVMEKVPLALLAAASAAITYVAQGRGGAVQSAEAYPFSIRLANATVSYATYLAKTVWPRGLAFFYPHPGADLEIWKAAAAGLFLLAVTAAALARVRRLPWLAVGWFWYLGTLIPVIGLVQVGGQAMADRYTYVSLVGIFVIFSWSLGELCVRCRGGRVVFGAVAGAVLAVLAVQARAQLGTWRDSTALFRHALEVTRGNWTAHNNLANVLAREGRVAEAIPHYRRAIDLNPGRAAYPFNLANALVEVGSLEEAERYYRMALKMRKDYPEAHTNLAVVLARTGRPGEALDHLSESLAAGGESGTIHFNMATILSRMGRFDEAAAHYREALLLDPSLDAARKGLEGVTGREDFHGGREE